MNERTVKESQLNICTRSFREIRQLGSLRVSHKRNLANLRERKRMMLINRGFEVLRAKLLLRHHRSSLVHDFEQGYDSSSSNKQRSFSRGGRIKGRKNRLTKVDILRSTILYIKELNRELAGGDLSSNSNSLRTICQRDELDYSGDCADASFMETTAMIKSIRGKRQSESRKRSRQNKHAVLERDIERQVDDCRNKELVVYLNSMSPLQHSMSETSLDSCGASANGRAAKYLLSCSRYRYSFFHGYEEEGLNEFEQGKLKSVSISTKLWVPARE